jgi:Protein of unknown function (DUF429)
MKIFGLDFTSAPSHKKPITCAACTFVENLLHTEACLIFPDFKSFEAFLRSEGPWIAALDFPFGQPRKLLANLGWPETWESYIKTVSAMDKQEFEETLRRYCESRPTGDKQHLRATDALADARSPMMLHRVPVGKMFFQGVSRLLASDVSILPCRPTSDSRIVIEGYPALVARKWIGKRSYKSDEREKQTADKIVARQHIVEGICSRDLATYYGFTLDLCDTMADMLIQDPMGDFLDALLCAIQAAWAYTQRDNGYGISADCDSVEGWIVDPRS